jgi:hypothetical protein
LGLAAGLNRRTELVLLGLGLALAAVIRVVLWPTDGLRADLDQFVLWVHGIATTAFGRAYDQDVAFGPVIVGIWGLLAAIEPAFRIVTDAADPAIRSLMKLPASLADLAIAGLVWAHLRSISPRWAVAAAVAIALHPAVIYVSAWWGQYESVYVLLGVIAFVLATRGHNLWAAAFVAAALMAKPQAVVFLVPFGAWFLARDGWRGALAAAAVGVATIIVAWLPFLAANGPANYLGYLDHYSNDVFPIVSLRAWNPWWLFQEWVAPGDFVLDTNRILGPLTLRWIGYGLAAIGELAVLVAVLRRPTASSLGLGVAASTLVVFCCLTGMHERYVFAALAFLLLAGPDPRTLATWIVLSAVFALNLLVAIPPAPEIAAGFPRVLTIAGSVVMVGVLVATLALLWSRPAATGEAPAG